MRSHYHLAITFNTVFIIALFIAVAMSDTSDKQIGGWIGVIGVFVSGVSALAYLNSTVLRWL